ncbi:MAG: winged helix-turn-helix transcriptional regulator [archaeon]
MTVSLSDVDKRILSFMIYDGAHFSEHEMAKRLKLSQTTVNYNIRSLRERGVILGYKYRVDPAKVGYPLMVWFFGEFGEKVDVDRIVAKLFSHGNIFDVLVMTGHYDIVLKAYFRSREDIDGLLTWIGNELKGQVRRISAAIVTSVHKIHQKPPCKDSVFVSRNERMVMSMKIADPSLSMSEIAKKTGMHRNTVASCWKSLWEKKVLLKKSPIINPDYFSELGISFKAIVLIDAVIGKKEKAVNYLAGLKEVHELTSIAYENDLLAVMRVDSLHSSYKLVREINSKDFISATETYPVFVSFTKNVGPA